MNIKRDFGVSSYNDHEFSVRKVAVEKIDACVAGGKSLNVSFFYY